MRRFFLVIIFFSLFFTLDAQETITVMQYNLLQYGNAYGSCNESTNNTQHKDECIRTILDEVRPDIFTVCEFGRGQQLQTDFLKHNLNVGCDYWRSDNIINYANSTLINHLFYDSRKMGLKRHVALRTSPRDSDVYELYMKTPSLVAGDTIKLVCIVTHPKAGQGYEVDRLTTMRTVMNHIRQHYANENVLIMGDFNMYGASESGYQLLTRTYDDNECLFIDPLSRLGGVGEWNNNTKYAAFHTQSTHGPSAACFSNGGMDDRFDFILFSDEIFMGENLIRYVDRSYYAVGNDGQHFNQSINQGGNSAVSATVAQALFDASDHLPVTLKLSVYAQLGVGEAVAAESFRVYPNPTGGLLNVDVVGTAAYQITNVMGQVVKVGTVGDTHQVDVGNLASGLYFIHVNGGVAKFVKETRY